MIRFLSKANASGLRGVALLRLDFNTEDEWRMRASLPTIRLLVRHSRAAVIVSHRGRPKPVRVGKGGAPGKFDAAVSLRNDGIKLERMLGRKIRFVPHFDFHRIVSEIRTSPRGSTFLLQNIRLLKGETTLKPELAKRLAALGDYYVNDAFAVCHHPGDSVVGVEKFLPSFAGLELENEIKVLSRAMRAPRKPLVIILGGAKVRDKLGVLRYFRNKADAFLLGGGPANTILKLRGKDIGNSLADMSTEGIQRLARARNVLTPVDWKTRDEMILDAGPKTVAQYNEWIRKAGTVIWNGPLGRIETERFSSGSLAIAKTIASNRRAFSIAGGGETVMFLKKHRLDGKFSFISTGGGAMLAFLAGEKLRGIEALKTGHAARKAIK